MRRYPLLLALILPVLAVGVRAGGEKPKNIVFTSKEGKFSVSLPTKPVKQTQKARSDIGELQVHLFIVDQKERGFIASYTDYPNGSVTDQTRQKVLDACRDGNVKGVKGKLASEKKITLGEKKHEGRELLIELPGGKATYRARIFLVGDRLYQVIAIGPDDFARSQAVTDYLDSFQVKE